MQGDFNWFQNGFAVAVLAVAGAATWKMLLFIRDKIAVPLVNAHIELVSALKDTNKINTEVNENNSKTQATVASSLSSLQRILERLEEQLLEDLKVLRKKLEKD